MIMILPFFFSPTGFLLHGLIVHTGVCTAGLAKAFIYTSGSDSKKVGAMAGTTEQTTGAGTSVPMSAAGAGAGRPGGASSVAATSGFASEADSNFRSEAVDN